PLRQTENGFTLEIARCTANTSSVVCDLNVHNDGPERAPFMIIVPTSRLFVQGAVLPATDGIIGKSRYAPLSSHPEIVDHVPGDYYLKATLTFKGAVSGNQIDKFEIEANRNVWTFSGVPLSRGDQTVPPTRRR